MVEAGMRELVEIRVQDYRDVDDGPFDAISSIGMAEHVGAAMLPTYAAHLYDLLRPQGRLLNHAISRRPRKPAAAFSKTSFIDRYVFPDGEIEPLATMIEALEGAGFEVRDVESLREHYALTLRAWVGNLEANWDEAVGLQQRRPGPGVAAVHGRRRRWRSRRTGSGSTRFWRSRAMRRAQRHARHPHRATAVPGSEAVGPRRGARSPAGLHQYCPPLSDFA